MRKFKEAVSFFIILTVAVLSVSGCSSLGVVNSDPRSLLAAASALY